MELRDACEKLWNFNRKEKCGRTDKRQRKQNEGAKWETATNQ